MRRPRATRPLPTRPQPTTRHAAAARGVRRLRADAGYTLVEVMMAVTITAVMASMVVISLPSRRADVEEDARGFSARARLAAQESIISGATIGLKADEEGYAFFRYAAGVWRPVQDPQALTRRAWAASPVVALSIENAPPLDDLEPEEIAALPPLVRFDPTGLVTPFTLTLREGRDRFTVAVGDAGDVHVMEGAGAPVQRGRRS